MFHLILRIVINCPALRSLRVFLCPNNLTPQATTTSTARLTVYENVEFSHALAGVYCAAVVAAAAVVDG